MLHVQTDRVLLLGSDVGEGPGCESCQRALTLRQTNGVHRSEVKSSDLAGWSVACFSP